MNKTINDIMRTKDKDLKKVSFRDDGNSSMLLSEEDRIDIAIKQFDKWKLSLFKRNNKVHNEKHCKSINSAIKKVIQCQKVRTDTIKEKWKRRRAETEPLSIQAALEQRIKTTFNIVEKRIKFLSNTELAAMDRIKHAMSLQGFINEHINPQYRPALFEVIIGIVKDFHPTVQVNFIQIEEYDLSYKEVSRINCLHLHIAKMIKQSRQLKLFYKSLSRSKGLEKSIKLKNDLNEKISTEERAIKDKTSLLDKRSNHTQNLKDDDSKHKLQINDHKDSKTINK